MQPPEWQRAHKNAFSAMHCPFLAGYEEAKASFVETTEEKVDRYEDELGTYLVKLNQKDLSSRDSHDLSIMLHCIGDFERISDHAVNILGAARELDQKKLAFSDEALAELNVLCRAVKDIVKTAVSVFEEKDTVLAGKVEPLEEVIDEFNQEAEKASCAAFARGKVHY